MQEIWPTIHAERRALADDLSGADASRWSEPSLCAGWSVHDVLAHLVATAKMTPPKFFAKFAGSGFNFDRFANKEIAAERAGGPEATLAEFRAVEQRSSSPPGPKDSWLGEILVHSADIRRPLGIAHDYPLPAVTRALAFYSKSNAIIGARNRIKGLTLTANDIDYSVGAGPLVEGPAMSLLLAACGRKAALDDLSGPGVDTLRERP
jgi:uncharacterized protein (TIGR03083 family)